jgi:predicted dehydrogenase
MAHAYANVLADINVPFTVVGRDPARARSLASLHGMAFLSGGVDSALRGGRPKVAIVAVPVESLTVVGSALARAGVRRILLEKPGGLDIRDLSGVADAADRNGSRVYVAYNRRFLASVAEARRRIEAAGGALSMFFDYSEAASRIEASPASPATKARWVIANSSHVIDLAFHLCGEPASLDAQVAGSLPWHPAGAVFTGQGATERGTVFCYHTDWRSPGRWRLEIALPDERLILSPLEKLQHILPGEFDPKPVDVDQSLDLKFKPGLHCQVCAFLGDEAAILMPIRHHLVRIASYINRMGGYVPEPQRR